MLTVGFLGYLEQSAHVYVSVCMRVCVRESFTHFRMACNFVHIHMHATKIKITDKER